MDALLKCSIAVGASAPIWLASLQHVRQRIDAAVASGESTTLALIDGTTAALVVAVALVTGVLYEVLPTARWGRTPGKWLFGLAVVDVETMTPPGLGRATRRYLTRFILNLLIIGILLAARPVAAYPRRQGLHDKVAHTWVVRKSATPFDWQPLQTHLRQLTGPTRWLSRLRAQRLEQPRPPEAAPEAEQRPQDHKALDLVGLSDRPETEAAVGSVEAVLERVFQVLGPPPEGLSHDKEPVVHGGGGNAQ